MLRVCCRSVQVNGCERVGLTELSSLLLARKTVSELRRIYFRLRERVFSGQAPEERGKELEELAIEIFTPTRRMLDDADQELGPKSVA